MLFRWKVNIEDGQIASVLIYILYGRQSSTINMEFVELQS